MTPTARFYVFICSLFASQSLLRKHSQAFLLCCGLKPMAKTKYSIALQLCYWCLSVGKSPDNCVCVVVCRLIRLAAGGWQRLMQLYSWRGRAWLTWFSGRWANSPIRAATSLLLFPVLCACVYVDCHQCVCLCRSGIWQTLNAKVPLTNRYKHKS